MRKVGRFEANKGGLERMLCVSDIKHSRNSVSNWNLVCALKAALLTARMWKVMRRKTIAEKATCTM